MPRRAPDDQALDFGDVRGLVDVFRQLSDTTRMGILMLLSEGPRNVNSIVDALEIPQPGVSHHLGLLRAGNLVCANPVGREVFYDLDERVTPAAGRGFRIDLAGVTVLIDRSR